MKLKSNHIVYILRILFTIIKRFHFSGPFVCLICEFSKSICCLIRFGIEIGKIQMFTTVSLSPSMVYGLYGGCMGIVTKSFWTTLVETEYIVKQKKGLTHIWIQKTIDLENMSK